MTPSREKRPKGREWKLASWKTEQDGELASSTWLSGAVRVISSLVLAELPDGAGIGLQWLVSVSNHGARPLQKHVDRALRAFGMVGTEEDNHHPGVARHFWMPCEAEHRAECDCKSEEVTVVESDGYRWTNPHQPAECRGCEYQRLIGRPCPIHARSATR